MVTADEIFAKVEARVNGLDRSTQKLLYDYKFVISDDSGSVVKTWMLVLKTENKVYVGDSAADVTMTLSESAMCSIGGGSLTIEEGIAQGKITVDGSKDIAIALQPAISLL